jgi:hypothetical protein
MVLKFKYRSITSKQVKELLLAFHGRFDFDLSKRFLDDIYLLNDGRVIHAPAKGRGLEYPSLEDFLTRLNQLEQQFLSEGAKYAAKKWVDYLLSTSVWTTNPAESSVSHIIYSSPEGNLLSVSTQSGSGVLYRPDYQGWEDRVRNAIAESQALKQIMKGEVDQVAESLGSRLRLAVDQLDYTLTSLNALDTKILRLGKLNCLQSEPYPMLTAYFGEVIRRCISGEWQLQYATIRVDTAQAITPFIVAPNGKSSPPSLVLFKDFYDRQGINLKYLAEQEVARLWLEENPYPYT